ERLVNVLARYVEPRRNYVGREVSKGAAHAAHGPAHTIGLLADRWNQIVWNLAYFVRDVEWTVRRLTHTIIPRQINRQTRPLRARTRKLEKGQARQARQTNALRRWTHTQIVRHIYPSIRRLNVEVTKEIPLRIRREELKRS